MDFPSQEIEKNSAPPQPPAKAVLLMTGALVLMGMMMGGAVVAIACDLQNMDIKSVFDDFGKNSPLEMRNFMRGSLLIQHLMSFLVPALLVTAMLRYKNWSYTFLMERAPKMGVLLAGVACVFLSFPLAQALVEANSWIAERIPFLKSFAEAEKSSVSLIEGLLVMESPWELMFSLLVMALVPALGEEMIFRGIVQQQLMRRLRPVAAVLGTAFVFALIHFQFKEFFALFGMGALLGFLFYWTRNLWVSVAGHFFFNAMQVFAAWYGMTEVEKMPQTNLAARIGLTVVFTALLIITANKLRKSANIISPPPTGEGVPNADEKQ